MARLYLPSSDASRCLSDLICSGLKLARWPFAPTVGAEAGTRPHVCQMCWEGCGEFSAVLRLIGWLVGGWVGGWVVGGWVVGG